MRTIGIDFGTCNIKGAERKLNGDIVPVKLGKNIDKARIPNVILYEQKKDGYHTLVGNIALKKAVSEQDRIRNIKSHLQERDWARTLSFGKTVTAYDVTLDIMKSLYAEIHGGNKNMDVTATVTVPVNFSKRQQLIVEKAAQEAGFTVNGVITEPFASLFFLMQDYMEDEGEHNVLIFDFGGGTLDLCLAGIKDTKKGKKIETQSTVGISYGGNDLNNDILKNILEPKAPEKVKLALEGQENILRNMTNRYYFMEVIDEMKEEFFQADKRNRVDRREVLVSLFDGSIVDLGEISVNEIYDMLDGQEWKKRIGKLLDRLFDDSDFIADEVTDIFMVGGTSFIPYFRNILAEYFRGSGHGNAEGLFELNDEMDMEERVYSSVSSGAVIYNELQDEYAIKDKIPFMIYAKDDNNRKCAKLTKNDYYRDYYSSLAPLTAGMKEAGRISIYQTVFGEEEKEVYLGDIMLDEDMVSYATLYRLMVDKDRNIYMEIGYLLRAGEEEDKEAGEEDLFCVDGRLKLEILV